MVFINIYGEMQDLETNFQQKFDAHLFDEHLETSCQTCGKCFTHFNEYYSHLLTHVDPINCDGCNKQFLDKTRYDYHIKMGHKDEPANGFCPTCGILILLSFSK